MKEINIEHLTYLLKQAKNKKQPQPIFFLGAGVSKTGNIPLAGEIVKNILDEYADSPFIKDLKIDQRTYPNLMDCLQPAERDELLKGYIRDAKINVTHIYLAQLLNEGYIDYVLTVNFDNLMLRALALYNIYPATYDMAILKDLTTSTFKEKSVVYLHGQNHGLWLLNTVQEMDKVKAIVQRIFDSIKNGRPWVFIGYSGEDPIFEHIKNLGRFDNGLYWVSYNDHIPNDNVLGFLSESNTNAYLIRGYDSDSFMLKLNSELGLDQPTIVDKPFTAIKGMLDQIVDIDDEEHFQGVKERLEISKRQVDEAIQQFELGKIESSIEMRENTEIDLLKKEIINLIITKNFNEEIVSNIEDKVRTISDAGLENLLSELYSNWGIYIVNLTKSEKTDINSLYNKAFAKFQKATELKSEKPKAFNNWGVSLGVYAKTKKGKEADDFFNQAFEKFKMATEILPTYESAYHSWGILLGNFAKTKTDDEAIRLFNEAFEKFNRAIEIKPDMYEAFYNWGSYIFELAKTKDGVEAETLYNQAFEKFQKVIEIKPDHHKAFYVWGTSLGKMAEVKEGKNKEILQNKAFEKLQRSVELGGNCYNLACMSAVNQDKINALFYLDLSLKRDETTFSFVEKDSDWVSFLTDIDFVHILHKYKEKKVKS
jgi:tetratricopeptide (TPR) repeat protein